MLDGVFVMIIVTMSALKNSFKYLLEQSFFS
ncbi:hypothetical protein F964_02787 [Acinetobacter guillouiae NIPH 991]|uniref:Uncharacterized protein n=1 Tax=Acinetobacter guillouiae NIPH 991 TaxID=1217656 RepID=N8YBQ4_ACIGI|nr:hypothetical protein F964_02787 [Acinetobacter guillouiae NIPH 991]